MQAVVQVDPPEEDLDVIVVGDTHGQLHDVLLMCALSFPKHAFHVPDFSVCPPSKSHIHDKHPVTSSL